MTPTETITKIAEIASDISSLANVGGMELAGQLVSVLAAHPEKVDDFLNGKLSFADDDSLAYAEKGCLSWRAVNGRIVTPTELRTHKSRPDS